MKRFIFHMNKNVIEKCTNHSITNNKSQRLHINMVNKLGHRQIVKIINNKIISGYNSISPVSPKALGIVPVTKMAKHGRSTHVRQWEETLEIYHLRHSSR